MTILNHPATVAAQTRTALEDAQVTIKTLNRRCQRAEARAARWRRRYVALVHVQTQALERLRGDHRDATGTDRAVEGALVVGTRLVERGHPYGPVPRTTEGLKR